MLRALLCLFCLTLCFPCPARASSPRTLRMHVWVSYMPTWLLEAFTRETGIHVSVTFFADNRDLYRKLKEEGEMQRFDIVTPSAETVQQLAEEKLLHPLSPEKIPSMKLLDPWFAGLGYDKNFRFSVPLYWGGLGIVIDKTRVPEKVASRVLGYKDLWMPELKGLLILPNDLRSLMSIMLLHLGYSVNDSEPAHLEAAMAALESLAPSVNNFDSVDQVEDLAKLSVGVGVVWANEFFARPDQAATYQFIFPKEGSPLWIDTMAVPANAPNPEGAQRFIDFVLRPENLARLSEQSGYAVAEKAAVAKLPESLQKNIIVYPPEQLRSRFEPELMLPPAMLEKLEKRWIKLRDKL